MCRHKGPVQQLMSSVMGFYAVFFSPTASATPTLKELMNELRSVSDLHTLGVNLDLKRHQLSEIEKNHRGDDKRCRTEVLGCWLDNTTNPTWKAVAEALYLMEAHSVADTIQRKYITSNTTSQGIALLYSCIWILGSVVNLVMFKHQQSLACVQRATF